MGVWSSILAKTSMLVTTEIASSGISTLISGSLPTKGSVRHEIHPYESSSE